MISTPAQRCQGVTNPPTLSPPCQGSGPHLCTLCLYRSVETASGPHPSLSSLPANWCHWAGRVLGAVTDTVTCWVPDGTVRACFSPKRRDPALLLPLQCWLQLSLHGCSPPPMSPGREFPNPNQSILLPPRKAGRGFGQPKELVGGMGALRVPLLQLRPGSSSHATLHLQMLPGFAPGPVSSCSIVPPSKGIHGAFACHPLLPSHAAQVRGDHGHRSSFQNAFYHGLSRTSRRVRAGSKLSIMCQGSRGLCVQAGKLLMR